MQTIFLFSQNTDIRSFEKYVCLCDQKDKCIFLTTHELFDHEVWYLNSLYRNTEYISYADLLSDDEMADCDIKAYNERTKSKDLSAYVAEIKRTKNQLIASKIRNRFPGAQGFLLSYDSDLGIDDKVWIKYGFKKVNADFFFGRKDAVGKLKKTLKKSKTILNAYMALRKIKYPEKLKSEEFHIYEENGFKYILIGKTHRILYRISVPFIESEEELKRYNSSFFYDKEKAVYMVAWHEHDKCKIPDDPRYKVAWIQDGYLPYNYADYTYSYKPDNVCYFVWDTLGAKLFLNKGLPCEMLPFRKKLYLPEANFKPHLKTILVATSGTGDWNALKNRSDDDRVVKAFVEIARRHPEITVIYRCHPGWVQPNTVGINSIDRVREYFETTGLSNIVVSSNIPSSKEGKVFLATYPRSSLEEDVKKADMIFGEHSIAMVDAGFKSVPFSMVNFSGRRNFSLSLEELGFPYCDTIDKMENLIKEYNNGLLQSKYKQAVEKYNRMTDEILAGSERSWR